MIEFGKTLREAREAKGLTVSELADKTRLMHQVIEGLESENFSRIAAPIYGRGFVKLICEVLELDAKPLCEAFTELYQQHRDNPGTGGAGSGSAGTGGRGTLAASSTGQEPTIDAAGMPRPQEPASQEPDSVPPAPPTQPSFFDPQPATSNQLPATSNPPPAPSNPPPSSPFRMAGTDPAMAPDPDIPTTPRNRYRLPGSDFNNRLATAFTLSRAKRLALLAIPLLLIIFGLILGIRSLYRMTMPSAEIEERDIEERDIGGRGTLAASSEKQKPTNDAAGMPRPQVPATQVPATSNPKPAAPRERVAINPLYVD